MDPARHREIASRGGVEAHKKGTAHEWNKETAATAGKKGGDSISRDRQHMAKIGALGGRARVTKRSIH